MYLFIDTETGGLTPQHSLLTVSCIGVDERFDIIPAADRSHGLYLRLKHAEYALTAGALSVNKINIVEHNENGLELAVAKQKLLAFIEEILKTTGKKRLVPAGHNVGFDVQFLRANLLNDAEWDRYFTYPALDTAAIARFLNAGKMVGGGYSLTALRDKFLPHMRDNVMHNAEIDNLVTIELAKKFVSFLPAQHM